MPITLKGIRITSLSVSADGEGEEKISANYHLIASNDKVLARETLSSGKGYGENTFIASPATIKALRDAIQLYKADVEMSLGLEAA